MIIKKFNPENLNNVAGGMQVVRTARPSFGNDTAVIWLDLQDEADFEAFADFVEKTGISDKQLYPNDTTNTRTYGDAVSYGYQHIGGLSEKTIDEFREYCRNLPEGKRVTFKDFRPVKPIIF